MSKIITRVLFHTLALEAEEKRLLETEDGGREIAKLQGRIAGRRQMVEFLEEQFRLIPGIIEHKFNTGVRIPALADILDDELDGLDGEIRTLREVAPAEYRIEDDEPPARGLPVQNSLSRALNSSVEAWAFFLWDVHQQAEKTKFFLLRRAEKGRDLDFWQSHQVALESAVKVFDLVDDEIRARKAAAELKRDETPDMFDQEEEPEDAAPGPEEDGSAPDAEVAEPVMMEAPENDDVPEPA